MAKRNPKFEYRNPKQIQMLQCSKQLNTITAPLRARRAWRFVIASGARQSHSIDRHVTSLLAMTIKDGAPRDDNTFRTFDI